MKVIIPPLHIKLGLIKQFVKVLPATGCFNYISREFSGYIFDGPQIRKFIKDACFV